MSIETRPIDPREVVFSLRAMARQMQRNARLMDRLYDDAATRHAAELRGAAHIAEGWASGIEADIKKEQSA